MHPIDTIKVVVQADRASLKPIGEVIRTFVLKARSRAWVLDRPELAAVHSAVRHPRPHPPARLDALFAIFPALTRAARLARAAEGAVWTIQRAAGQPGHFSAHFGDIHCDLRRASSARAASVPLPLHESMSCLRSADPPGSAFYPPLWLWTSFLPTVATEGVKDRLTPLFPADQQARPPLAAMYRLPRPHGFDRLLLTGISLRPLFVPFLSGW